MSTHQFFLTAWDWNYFVLAGCLGGLLVYAALAWRGMTVKVCYLVGGLAVCVLALVSPINVLADGYLFSAHMLQHLFMLLIAPPLFLLSLPPWDGETEFARPIFARANRVLTFPALTWLAGTGAMLLWHTPTLCNAATSSQPIHGLQIFTLLMMGGLFWWPVCGPQRRRHLSVLTAVLYLFSACVSCTLLGIWITFAPVEVCSVYLNPVDKFGILPLLRNEWKLTPRIDQQIGGLLMWVPACTIYLSVIMGMLLKWFVVGDEVSPAEVNSDKETRRSESQPSCPGLPAERRLH